MGTGASRIHKVMGIRVDSHKVHHLCMVCRSEPDSAFRLSLGNAHNSFDHRCQGRRNPPGRNLQKRTETQP